MDPYQQFLASKSRRFQPCGFEPYKLPKFLKGDFAFQGDIVQWAIRKGRAALFEDCGLGKTAQQLEFGHQVSKHTDAPVIIFAPLAVAPQTRDEGNKFGIKVNICRTMADIKAGVNITNYEKLEHFRPEGLGGIILDESSILKGFDGATRKAITEFASGIAYRLACTATPAPNDYMELGNHAEWLGVMTCTEMLATFFMHDGGDTSKWRLKGHARKEFWKWVCSWAIAIRSPEDIGHDGSKFKLPALHMHQVTVNSEVIPEGYLFPVEAGSLQERIGARRDSVDARVKACADIVNAKPGPWVIWCNLNDESTKLAQAIKDAVEVRGSMTDTQKEKVLIQFVHGDIDELVSKPSICGWGMNWQHCYNMAFVGLSDSWEQFYQALRRCWRFGQIHEVNAYVIAADTEGPVVRNIERKEIQAREMMDGMVAEMKVEMNRELHKAPNTIAHEVKVESGKGWKMIQGDCVEQVAALPDASIDFSIFSPPFASLYTYSQSERDMGNCRSHGEFYEHLKFLAGHLFRVLKEGRLLSFHCMNLPKSKERDGVIGIWDFRGSLIRLFEDAGFTFHSEVCIWKDPVTAMQRTKAIGLLYKQLRKDSALSRQGIPDYLVTMRKAGVNAEPITHVAPPKGASYKHARNVPANEFPVERWQNYASPVWMDINPSNTLQKESAREHDDERHICPLQLDVIERAIELWTNPGDVVLSPFAGIGSEGHVAIQAGREFVGVELKPSYYVQAVANLKAAEAKQTGLFTVGERWGITIGDADLRAEEVLEMEG